jgi:hypothetical protein
MIALPSQLPLLRVGRFDLAAYDSEWVEEGIREAAREAGHEEWFFAADITRSLMIYLRSKFPGTVITIEELNRRLQQILEKIGYQDIGNRLCLLPPEIQVSLRDIAHEADGLEMGFFQLLGERLEEMLGLGARRITLSHTRDGVKLLRAARHWSGKCGELEQEIIGFLSARMRQRPECAVEVRAN